VTIIHEKGRISFQNSFSYFVQKLLSILSKTLRRFSRNVEAFLKFVAANLFFAFTNFCGTMYEWWQDICHTLSSDLLMVKWFVARVADVW
jgi:hypothetical protein